MSRLCIFGGWCVYNSIWCCTAGHIIKSFGQQLAIHAVNLLKFLVAVLLAAVLDVNRWVLLWGRIAKPFVQYLWQFILKYR